MITIISGSNRKDNLTLPFAKYAYDALVKQSNEDVKFIDLSQFDTLHVDNGIYAKDNQPLPIQQLQDEVIIPSEKFWFFIPEYNGSYPGIIKLMLDTLSVRHLQESFASKKVCLTGIASGRAGNLRGMDHLADVLNHLGMHVHPNKLPISSIYKLLDANKNVADEDAKKTLENQIKQLLEF